MSVVELFDEVVLSGARRTNACEVLGLSFRTLQRWCHCSVVHADGHPDAPRPLPTNKLSDDERGAVLALCHRPDYARRRPQIVPREAAPARYVVSESTLYRLLREHREVESSWSGKAPRKRGESRIHCATGPNQVWCWDITWLAGPTRGLFYHLYLVMDLYSRKIVGWEVYEHERAEHASVLMRRCVIQCSASTVLHGPRCCTRITVACKKLPL